MRSVHVIGAGMTRFGILQESIMELTRNASMQALDSSGTLGESFDHVFVGTQNPDEFTGIGHLSTLTADHLSLVPAGATRVESGPSSGAIA